MTKKDYERAAELVQDVARFNPPKEVLRVAIETFVIFFRGDNGRFNEERFRRACVVGANVRKRD